MKKIILQLVLCCFCIVGFSQPTISSFSPLSGPAGSSVTITGTNFSTVLNENIVSFGSARGTVTVATPTSLTVTVPLTATYDRVSVSNTSLPFTYSATSTLPFLPSWNALHKIDSFSFKEKYTYNATGSGGANLVIADLDGDGKNDLACANGHEYSSFSLYRNTGTNEQFSFAPKIDLSTGGQLCGPTAILSKDLTGDGKPELIVTAGCLGPGGIEVRMNLSTPGTLNFNTKYFIPTGNYGPQKTFLSDFDQDGKPDLVSYNSQGFAISIFRNISGLNVVSFESVPQIITLTQAPLDMIVADLDQDGKEEIVTSHSYTDFISIFHNISQFEVIAFDPPININLTKEFSRLAVGDLNNDLKPELICVGRIASELIIYKNQTSTPGNFVFVPTDILKPYSLGGLTDIHINDFDSDNLPDLTLSSTSGVGILKNKSTSGNISFETERLFKTSQNGNYRLTSGDLNGDGKPDIALRTTTFSQVGQLTILRNDIPESASLCPGGNLSLTSPVTGTIYQWQVKTDADYSNITDNSQYIGTTNNVLQILGVPSSFYGYTYRCVVDGIAGRATSMIFKNQWIGTIDQSWENPLNWSCGSFPDSNTDVIFNSGTIIINSNITIRSLTVNNGATITVNPGFTLTITN